MGRMSIYREIALCAWVESLQVTTTAGSPPWMMHDGKQGAVTRGVGFSVKARETGKLFFFFLTTGSRETL